MKNNELLIVNRDLNLRYAIGDKRMIIGIDARFFGPQAKGLGRYTQKLIENLEKIDSQNQYVVFLRKKDFENWLPSGRNFKKVLADFPCYGFREQLFFPLLIKRHSLDLMHFPHFNVPVFYRGKFIVTVHDLILRHFPPKKDSLFGKIKYFFKDAAYRLVMRRAVFASKRIISVSEFVKKDILSRYKISEKKIIVVYEGSPENYSIGCNGYSEPEKTNRDPFILYVGNAYPHKNLDFLLKSFDLYLSLFNDKITKLVIAGDDGYFTDRLKRKNHDLIGKRRDKIIFAGFLEEEALKQTYKNARAFVFPSLCEGFGLPPLEAMACGVPVICSNETALPEILQDAVLYFDPRNPEDLAQKINIILKDEETRRKLIKDGYEQIKKYSWLKMAKDLKELYLKTVL